MGGPPSPLSIYHIVHYDKLPSIIAGGALLSDARIRTTPIVGTTIGMGDIKGQRLQLPVSCHPGCSVGEFVPFYFCPRSIMLYVIHRANHPNLAYRGGQEPIVHLEADFHETLQWARAQKRRWAITTSNAGARYTAFYNQESDLQRIDWGAVAARDWASAPLREAKQAEFLMHSSFPWTLVRRIGVVSMTVYARAGEIVKSAAHKPKIEIRREWYY